MATTDTRPKVRSAHRTAPRDRFDDIPHDLSRVGAHRGRARRGGGWVVFAWAALASGVLVAVGLFTLSRVDSRFQIDLPFGADSAASSAPSASAADKTPAITEPGSVDPAIADSLRISILNASPNDGTQDTLATQLKDAGWTVSGTANADERDTKKTTIYYSDKKYEGVAKGMAQIIGTGSITLSSAFPGAPITIVLGEDYTPAG
ncbi:LytR C-terminal domain-containing protein [Schumannella sp. 10F1B-5-1]|uniref:LytR C-terminal domain-containing protein n=1 Tax=Schumannella sp. 10F1B-5-1 TaxID=2590780 RepID=UPI001130F6C5|nr:LytR C-terminal domain-containing protein [Schumannella sp. 10F1B-5-1]TPW72865.1 LytR family transcriptional regulator [Schumannella sp. 10F1B-5-1]